MNPMHSVTEPYGPQAARIASLYDTNEIVTTVVWGLVVVALLTAVFRRRRADEAPDRVDVPENTKKKMGTVVGVAAFATAVTLVVLLVLSVVTGRAHAALPPDGAITYQVAGHRWWWEFQYDDPQPSQRFTTANEIHVPVGKPVLVKLESRDVIHSFWLPSLDGKRDLIPGKKSSLLFRADAAGRYVGQCAEYCGTQHANMRFVVVAEPQAEFDAWLAKMRSPARVPVSDEEKLGLDVFMKNRCSTCHAISGTEAFATAAPDLSHLASRQTIAAGTLANTPGHLGGWIADPQSSKPGVEMPSNALAPDDLNALLVYLRSLQ